MGGEFPPHYIGARGGGPFSKCAVCTLGLINSSQQAYEMICIIIPILQVRKWRHQGQIFSRVQGRITLGTSHRTALALESSGWELEEGVTHGASSPQTAYNSQLPQKCSWTHEKIALVLLFPSFSPSSSPAMRVGKAWPQPRQGSAMDLLSQSHEHEGTAQAGFMQLYSPKNQRSKFHSANPPFLKLLAGAFVH